jgi:uncharacterized protein YjbI with pentapeptide repeats
MASGLARPEKPGLDKMVTAISESAQTARSVLTGMLLVALTLTATLIAATDDALFRDSAEVFPSLGVKIKLSTAFALAPPVFAFLHINALLQLHLLARRLRVFEAAMFADNLPACDRAAWRRLIHGFSFAQLLTPEIGLGHLPHRLLLGAVSWFAVVLVPVALLLAAQVSFLRYQSDAITFVHQTTLVADVLVLLWFHAGTWRAVVKCNWAAAMWSALALSGTVMLAWFSWTQAVPPVAENETNAVRWKNENAKAAGFGGLWEFALQPALKGDAVLPDRLTVVTGWSWTRRYMDLSGKTLINAEAKPDLLHPFRLDERDLAEAQRNMIAIAVPRRSLRFADMENAHIFSANISEIDGRKANFSYAKMQGAQMEGAKLHGAALVATKFDNAKLNKAELTGVDLHDAELKGASLSGAKLHGANLTGVFFDAELSQAEFDGAYLFNVNFNKSKLDKARFYGAYLGNTDFSNAEMSSVQFKASYLVDVKFGSINIDSVNISASVLRGVTVSFGSNYLYNCAAPVVDSRKYVTFKAVEGGGSKELLTPVINIKSHGRDGNVVICNADQFISLNKFNSEEFAAVLRDISCNDQFMANAIAKNIIKLAGDNIEDYSRSSARELTRPDKGECVGLWNIDSKMWEALYRYAKEGEKSLSSKLMVIEVGSGILPSRIP